MFLSAKQSIIQNSKTLFVSLSVLLLALVYPFFADFKDPSTSSKHGHGKRISELITKKTSSVLFTQDQMK